MPASPLSRPVALFAVTVLAAFSLAVFFLISGVSENRTAETTTIGQPFSLTSHKGETVDNATLRGKPYLAFFGFTHCPEICPTALFELTDLMKALGTDADRLNVLFITVDPERDSQELLGLYMSSFDPRIIALRGNMEQTRIAVDAFSAYARKVPTGGDGYTMDHTAGVYLMNAEGVFRGKLDMHEPREVRLRKIQNLVKTLS